MKRSLDVVLSEERACKWLTSFGFDRHNLKKHKGKWKQTAMTTACYGGNLEMCQFLYNNSDINILQRTEKDGQSPMHKACRMGHLSIAKWIKSKFDEANETSYDIMNLLDYEGSTPMHLACNGGHLSVVKWIINELLPIHALTTDMQSIRRNITYLNNTSNHLGESCLSLACQSTNIELVGYLIKNGINCMNDEEHIDHNVIKTTYIQHIKWSLLKYCINCLLDFSNFKNIFLLGISLEEKNELNFISHCKLYILSGFSDGPVKLIFEYCGFICGRQLRNVREFKELIEASNTSNLLYDSDT